MTTVEILKKAKHLIRTPARWVKGRSSKRRSGAMAYCATGAIEKVAGLSQSYHVEDILTHASHIKVGLVDWNDDPRRTHFHVLKAFDKAIAYAEKHADAS